MLIKLTMADSDEPMWVNSDAIWMFHKMRIKKPPGTATLLSVAGNRIFVRETLDEIARMLNGAGDADEARNV
jgi:hypothetical protein